MTKILIQQNTAYGVEYFKNGRIYNAYANKEVILSAGAYNSPQILLLSGIGPKQHLLKFGIKPIQSLPVGQKLFDHPYFFGLIFSFNQSIAFDATEALQDEAFIKLFNEGDGPLRSTATAGSLLFTTTELAENNVTDIEFFLISSNFALNQDDALVQVNKETYDSAFKPYEDRFISTLLVIHLHPESHGRVELRSANPFVHPKIFAGFFTDPDKKDVKAMTAGIREGLRIMLSPTFEKYGVEVVGKVIAGCRNYEYNSDEYWECALRHITTSAYHPMGTCKMGPRNDPDSVVDYQMKVHGIRDLRVVDASVIPITLTAHTNVPAFMIGEKAADMIKEDYLLDLK